MPGHRPHRECRTAARVAVELGEHDAAHLDDAPGRRSRRSPLPAPSCCRARAASLPDPPRRAARSISAIISSSTCRRPAVSRISVSHSFWTRDSLRAARTVPARPSRPSLRAPPGRRSAAPESRAGPSPRADTRRDRPAAVCVRACADGRELGGKRRLARTLQPHHHHDAGGPLEVERCHGSAQERRQLLVDDAHDLLLRGEALVDFFADQARLDPRDEVLHDAEVDVRFEQRPAHFLAHGLANVVLGELSARTDGGEDLLEFLGQTREHTPANAIAPSRHDPCAPRASACTPPADRFSEMIRNGERTGPRACPAAATGVLSLVSEERYQTPGGGGKSQNEGALGRHGPRMARMAVA